MESKADNNLNDKEIIGSTNDFKLEENSLLVEKAFDAESTMVKKEEGLHKKAPELADKATLSIEKSMNPKKTYLKKETNVDDIFRAIEAGFPKESTNKQYIFPHPRYWIGPRFMALWALPILLIKSFSNLIRSSNPVKPYQELDYTINKSETIYTSTKKAIDGSNSMRFFGVRFITIWVLPLAITGIFMEYLFISPLTGRVPFG